MMKKKTNKLIVVPGTSLPTAWRKTREGYALVRPNQPSPFRELAEQTEFPSVENTGGTDISVKQVNPKALDLPGRVTVEDLLEALEAQNDRKPVWK